MNTRYRKILQSSLVFQRIIIVCNWHCLYCSLFTWRPPYSRILNFFTTFITLQYVNEAVCNTVSMFSFFLRTYERLLTKSLSFNDLPIRISIDNWHPPDLSHQFVFQVYEILSSPFLSNYLGTVEMRCIFIGLVDI